MRKLNLFSFIAVIFFSLIYSGCEKNRQIIPNDSDTADVFEPIYPNEDENPEEPTFGTEHIPGIILSYPVTTDNEEIYMDINLTILETNPKISYDLFGFISEQLKETGFIAADAKNPDYTLDESEDGRQHLEEYAAQNLDYDKELFLKELPEIASYESPFNIAIDIYPVFLNDDYITFRKYAYYYTGGAHGNTISQLQTYNLTTGESLGLENIIKPDRMEDVREMVAAHMAYSYPIYENLKTVDEYIDSLNVWLGNGTSAEEDDKRITLKNYPLNNPAITSKGLVFTYERYELAPGVDGCPVVVLTYDEVKDCLKAPFNELNL